MPKYYDFMICGYYLYFTSHCIVEAMHVHAGDKQFTEALSAKFFVKSDGGTVVQSQGSLTDKEMRKIRQFIKENYMDMYSTWSKMSKQGFYEG